MRCITVLSIFSTSFTMHLHILVAILCMSPLINGFPSLAETEKENLDLPEVNEIPVELMDEPKGFLARIGDSVKGYFVDKVENLFKNVNVECKSKRKKSGKLIATKEGKEFCQSRCREIYSKIDKARETIAWMKNYLPIGNDVNFKEQKNQHLSEYRCALNLPKTKLICDCPRAPEFSFGSSVKKYLRGAILSPSNVKRHYPYYGPYGGYYGGYGGYYGAGYYSNPLSELFSMALYPLKLLFIIVTLPFWIFLAFLIGAELDMIF